MHIKSLLAGPLAALAALALAACGASPSASPAAAPTDAPAATAAMDHSNMSGMDHSTMAGMSDAPYDATFIDGMIIHHEGAITMAKQALEQAERQEIKALAQAIVGAQEAEITQLREWRTSWYPDLADTGGMGMDMGDMEVTAGDAPFDQRFIQAMIPHHEGAIAMAQDALQKAERQEIKDLAQAIITAQEGEIAQMKTWLQEWYGIAE
jgi:uncharacterized protein (DUF305 family)